MNHQEHPGNCRIPLHAHIGGTSVTVASVARTAVEHARGLIVDDMAEVATAADLDLADEVLGRSEDGSGTGMVILSAQELQAFDRVVSLGAEYINVNCYAADPSFPEDAFADQILQGSSGYVTWCSVPSSLRSAGV